MAFTRRAFLHGAGAALALPLLGSLRSKAAPDGVPKRIVFYCTGNGQQPQRWLPTGTETAFVLPAMLAPLAPYQAELIVLSGVNNAAANARPLVRAHPAGMATILTGTEILKGASGTEDSYSLGGGISVDQHIGAQMPTPFHTLELGARAGIGTSNVFTVVSYQGASAPVTPEYNPYAAFQRLFGGSTPGDPGAQRALDIKRSALDHAGGEYAALAPQLPADDRAKVERHLDAIRAIEKQLVATGSCSATALPPGTSPADPSQTDQVGRLQMDIIARALACDLTRVVTFVWGGEQANAGVFPWLGISDNHHDLSHLATQPDAGAKLVQVGTFHAGMIAYLAAALQAIPEGAGSVFDSTVIVWHSGLANGFDHTHDNHPFILLGSAGGYLRTGRWVQANGAPHNDLLVSLCNAMGVPSTTFGNPAFCNGPLPNLTA